jgi:hypothetical protein
MRPVDDRVLVAELGFICDHRYKSGEIGATLIPFDGTYANQQHDVPVLVQKSPDHITPSDLSQRWSNGFNYIFLNDQELMGQLINYFKVNEVNSTKAVHFFFSGDFNGGIDILDHVVISLSGFSDGFAALSASCKSP